MECQERTPASHATVPCTQEEEEEEDEPEPPPVAALVQHKFSNYEAAVFCYGRSQGFLALRFDMPGEEKQDSTEGRGR